MLRAVAALLLPLFVGGWTPALADASPTEPTEIAAADSALTISGNQISGARIRYFRVEAAGATTVDTVTYEGRLGNGRVDYLATPPSRGQAWDMQDPELVIERLARSVAPNGLKVESGARTEVEAGHARYPVRHFQVLRPDRGPQHCFAFGVGVGRGAQTFRGNTEQIFGFHCMRPGMTAPAFILPEYFQGIVVRPLAARGR